MRRAIFAAREAGAFYVSLVIAHNSSGPCPHSCPGGATLICSALFGFLFRSGCYVAAIAIVAAITAFAFFGLSSETSFKNI